MTTLVHEAVATAVRAEMARQRRSQTELAELLGLSQASISRRLLGQTPLDVNELAAIATFLHCPMSVLIPTEVAA